MGAFQAIAPVRLYRMIADQIAGRIRQGDFPVGTRLPAERDLAEQLQVSRASVREALIALEIEGYVDVRVGTGVFVCPPENRHDAFSPLPHATDIGPFELLETRLLLEPECAALAAQKGTPEQLAAIRAASEAMSVRDAPGSHDQTFHEAISAACGNAALASAIAHIRQISDANPVFSRLDQHMVTTDVWTAAGKEHARIADAILERDATRARHAMYDHLLSVQERLRKDFGNEGRAAMN